MPSLLCRKLGISENGVLLKLLNKIYVALLTCFFALGGGAVGAIAGAIKWHTTETGFTRGFFVGAVTGAVTGVQLMDDLEPFSKVALISSLVNGKIFMEWVSPALLKAYQWQVSSVETSTSEFSYIFNDNDDVVTLGLSNDLIKELPVHDFYDAHTSTYKSSSTCIICLENMKNGDVVRSLPRCKHVFHLNCIDQWLMRQPTCPICRIPIQSKLV